MTHDSDAAIPTPEPDDERRSTRVAVNAEVSLRRAGHNHYRVRVYDASQHGCKLEFVERPEFEERVWVKFDGVDAIEGMVCWIDGFLVGVDFVHPIHPRCSSRSPRGCVRPVPNRRGSPARNRAG